MEGETAPKMPDGGSEWVGPHGWVVRRWRAEMPWGLRVATLSTAEAAIFRKALLCLRTTPFRATADRNIYKDSILGLKVL